MLRQCLVINHCKDYFKGHFVSHPSFTISRPFSTVEIYLHIAYPSQIHLSHLFFYISDLPFLTVPRPFCTSHTFFTISHTFFTPNTFTLSSKYHNNLYRTTPFFGSIWPFLSYITPPFTSPHPYFTVLQSHSLFKASHPFW